MCEPKMYVEVQRLLYPRVALTTGLSLYPIGTPLQRFYSNHNLSSSNISHRTLPKVRRDAKPARTKHRRNGKVGRGETISQIRPDRRGGLLAYALDGAQASQETKNYSNKWKV